MIHRGFSSTLCTYRCACFSPLFSKTGFDSRPQHIRIFYAMIDGVQRAFVVDLAPAELKATALGTFHTAIGLIALPGGLLAGLLWDFISPEATFVFALTLCLSALLLFIFVKNNNPSEKILVKT